MDSNKKSILKTISWRIITSITSMIIFYIFTGNVLMSLKIIMIGSIILTMIYYIHERIWNKYAKNI